MFLQLSFDPLIFFKNFSVHSQWTIKIGWLQEHFSFPFVSLHSWQIWWRLWHRYHLVFPGLAGVSQMWHTIWPLSSVTSSSRRSSSRPRFDAIFRNCTLFNVFWFRSTRIGYGFFSYKIQNCSNVKETTKYERRTYELKVETETFTVGLNQLILSRKTCQITLTQKKFKIESKFQNGKQNLNWNAKGFDL